MTHIKLIALDLDGTLLTRDKRVTKYTKDTLDQAVARGAAVCFATGRAICEMREIMAQLPCARYAIYGNGAGVLDLAARERIADIPFGAGQAREIARRIAPFDPMIEIFDGDEMLSDEKCLSRLADFDTADMLPTILRTRTPVNMAKVLAERTEPIPKMHVLFRDPPTRDRAMAAVRDLPLYVTHQLPSNLEFTNPGAHKGAGLALLSKRLNCARDEIMAAGDNLNDLPMFEVAGLSVAMGNAREEVRRAARFVTDDNEHEGVARAIEKFVLRGESVRSRAEA